MIQEVASKNRYSVKEADTVMALVTILNKVALDWEARQSAALEHHKNKTVGKMAVGVSRRP